MDVSVDISKGQTEKLIFDQAMYLTSSSNYYL